MANDLIKTTPEDDDGHNRPDFPPGHEHHSVTKAKKAERDAAQASRHGDTVYAFMRREDARDHLQSRWDWGDAPTWIILFLLSAIGLFIAITAYLLPQGQHMGPPPIRVY